MGTDPLAIRRPTEKTNISITFGFTRWPATNWGQVAGPGKKGRNMVQLKLQKNDTVFLQLCT